MRITTKRVESFSDGVIAIIITIMVFDIKFPHLHDDFTRRDVIIGLKKLAPELIAYFFSFLMLGVFWMNHHHLWHLVQRADEKLMWLNMHLLFWLSLIPFPTAMLGTNPFLPDSSAIYGIVLLMNAVAFAVMRHYVISRKLMFDKDTIQFKKEINKVNERAKQKLIATIFLYFLSVPLAYYSVYFSFVCFIIPPILFFIPDGVDDEQLEEQIIEKSK
jgi:uncharacterized membrane protein